MDQLPDDVLIHIFHFLPLKDLLVSCPSVCWQWNLCVRPSLPAKKTRLIIDMCRKTGNRLKRHGQTDDSVKLTNLLAFGHSLFTPLVKELRLDTQRRSFYSEIPDEIESIAPWLTGLNSVLLVAIRNRPMTTCKLPLSALFPTVTHLTLVEDPNCSGSVNGRLLKANIAGWKSLKSLEISAVLVTKMYRDSLVPAGLNCLAIREFEEFSFFSPFSYTRSVSSSLQELHLRVRNYRDLRPLEQFKSLKKLKLNIQSGCKDPLLLPTNPLKTVVQLELYLMCTEGNACWYDPDFTTKILCFTPDVQQLLITFNGQFEYVGWRQFDILKCLSIAAANRQLQSLHSFTVEFIHIRTFGEEIQAVPTAIRNHLVNFLLYSRVVNLTDCRLNIDTIDVYLLAIHVKGILENQPRLKRLHFAMPIDQFVFYHEIRQVLLAVSQSSLKWAEICLLRTQPFAHITTAALSESLPANIRAIAEVKHDYNGEILLKGTRNEADKFRVKLNQT